MTGAEETIGGPNAVLAALKARPRACRRVLVAEGRRPTPALDEIFRLAKANAIPYRLRPRRELDALGLAGHQGVVAIFDGRDYMAWGDFLASLPPAGPSLVLALDQVEDPGNLGALMRSALAFGAAGCVITRERGAALTTAAVKAAAGAAERLPLVRAVNMRRALGELKEHGFWLAAAEEDGDTDALGFDFPGRTVLVLGSEGRGLRPQVKAACDYLLTIPQRRDLMPSLNVAAAGAILMAAFHHAQVSALHLGVVQ